MKFLLSVSTVLMRASVVLVASQFIGMVIYGDDISFAQGNRLRILQSLGAGSSVQNYVADNQHNSGDGIIQEMAQGRSLNMIERSSLIPTILELILIVDYIEKI
jgi:hypothetical protein